MKSLIIYRCCDAELTKNEFKPSRPLWFNKLKCFKSFWDDYEKYLPRGFDFIVLHDGSKRQLYEYICGFTDSIIKINFNSNQLSLYETFNIAAHGFANNNYNCVHFIEDDFLARPGFFHTIQNGTMHFGLTTGFDHFDRYVRNDDITQNKECIQFLNSTNCHWRTAESTTCTWSCTKEVWDKIKETVYFYGLYDRELFRNLYKRDIRLWTPVPGYSTTLDSPSLSPGIDWKQINDKIDIATVYSS